MREKPRKPVSASYNKNGDQPQNHASLSNPDRDPVELHEQLWHIHLVCPGGGDYRWNDEWHTMESTVYGHPGEPKAGPSLPVSLLDIARGNFGITFQENGLRARVELTRAAKRAGE